MSGGGFNSCLLFLPVSDAGFTANAKLYISLTIAHLVCEFDCIQLKLVCVGAILLRHGDLDIVLLICDKQ